MFKKFTCTILAMVVLLMSTICAVAAEKRDFSIEKADEYFTLMNGCSLTALQNYGSNDVVDAIAYCGLDLGSPKTMFYLYMFYISNGVDTEKMTSDPAYSTQTISNLNGYLSKKGIKNTKSDDFIKKYNRDIYEQKLNFSTVGAYTFKAEKAVIEKMIDDGNVDFVIVGTGFMLKKCDVNADGKINDNDVKTIQNISMAGTATDREDKQKFLKYAADLNNDGKININDATALQQNLTA